MDQLDDIAQVFADPDMRMGVVRPISSIYGYKEVIASGLHNVVGGKDHTTEAVKVYHQFL